MLVKMNIICKKRLYESGESSKNVIGDFYLERYII